MEDRAGTCFIQVHSKLIRLAARAMGTRPQRRLVLCCARVETSAQHIGGDFVSSIVCQATPRSAMQSCGIHHCICYAT